MKLASCIINGERIRDSPVRGERIQGGRGSKLLVFVLRPRSACRVHDTLSSAFCSLPATVLCSVLHVEKQGMALNFAERKPGRTQWVKTTLAGSVCRQEGKMAWEGSCFSKSVFQRPVLLSVVNRDVLAWSRLTRPQGCDVL